MFVGHGLLAFAMAAAAARRLGADRRHALAVAAVAALFATVPDVDMLYAPLGLLGGVAGPMDAAGTFWERGNVVHRELTHSLVIGALAAVGFALWHRGSSTAPHDTHLLSVSPPSPFLFRAAGIAILTGVVTVGLLTSGVLPAAILTVFVLAGIATTHLGARLGLSHAETLWAAALGLLSHPFGDLLTGSPPALLYPFDVVVIADRVALAGDPTLNLLGAFALELAAVWLGVAAYFRLRGYRCRDHGDVRATGGLAYAGAALALPAPTLDVSYHFVFPLLGLGLLVALPTPRMARGAVARPVRAAATGLAAVTVATLAYTLVYLTVGW
jgi:membrane-bound metal-dependent hydrolase YbcI (DUF457 family)